MEKSITNSFPFNKSVVRGKGKNCIWVHEQALELETYIINTNLGLNLNE